MTIIFYAESIIQKQHVNERHLPGHYPILGTFAHYRKKQSYGRMIDLQWALKHIALKYI